MIYALGETVLDIIFKSGQAVTSRPGGAVLNTAVSLGRSKIPVALISEYGQDDAGKMIDDFLKNNGVMTKFSYRYQNGQTPVALAFLDEEKNASYTFYKPYPPDRLKVGDAGFTAKDILLFGSFYSLMDGVRDVILKILQDAKKKGVYIIYDPNIRKPHKPDMNRLQDRISENIAMADLVRASDEDFATIFNTPDVDSSWKAFRERGGKRLVYTMNKKGVHCLDANGVTHYEVPRLAPVSTIGAGDSFNAGMIYSLYTHGPGRGLDDAVRTGIAFASNVCMSYDNYISEEFAQSVRIR